MEICAHAYACTNIKARAYMRAYVYIRVRIYIEYLLDTQKYGIYACFLGSKLRDENQRWCDF